ncbi:MAG: hypothetical protein WA294_09755 [Acidobacteriaceae bacterium]
MKVLTVLAIALLWPCRPSLAQDHVQRIAPDGNTELSGVIDATRVRVTFRTSTLPIPANDPDHRRFVQCTYSRVPCSLTEDIRIFADGSEVIVPKAAYADLGDIATAELTTKHGHMVLTIQGGDASESYIAQLTFNRQRVYERRLSSGEDAGHPLEISHFYQ